MSEIGVQTRVLKASSNIFAQHDTENMMDYCVDYDLGCSRVLRTEGPPKYELVFVSIFVECLPCVGHSGDSNRYDR